MFDLSLDSVTFFSDALDVATERAFKDKKVLTFALIDFYDHDTLYTRVVEGLTSQYKFEANYKVNE